MNNKVLVIDDEIELREILTFDLESAGFEVVAAGSAREGLDIIDKSNIKLVVSDIRMPNGDGKELLIKLENKISKENLILILITGFSDLSIDEAFGLGAQALLNKPFNRRILVETITRLTTEPKIRWAHDLPPGKGQVYELNMTFNTLEEMQTHLKIGLGGVFIPNPGSLPSSEQLVKFNFTVIESKQTISGFGKARWVRNKPSENLKAGFGLEFYQVSNESMQNLLKWREQANSLAYIPRA
jgi:DNA-binding response OmpR family regulator